MQPSELVTLIADTIREKKLAPMNETRLSQIAGEAIADAILKNFLVLDPNPKPWTGCPEPRCICHRYAERPDPHFPFIPAEK